MTEMTNSERIGRALINYLHTTCVSWGERFRAWKENEISKSFLGRQYNLDIWGIYWNGCRAAGWRIAYDYEDESNPYCYCQVTRDVYAPYSTIFSYNFQGGGIFSESNRTATSLALRAGILCILSKMIEVKYPDIMRFVDQFRFLYPKVKRLHEVFPAVKFYINRHEFFSYIHPFPSKYAYLYVNVTPLYPNDPSPIGRRHMRFEKFDDFISFLSVCVNASAFESI